MRIAAKRRAGLTLVELVVVMVILVALGGILVPMLPSMLTRAHTSTCATNMAEVQKAIGEYQGMYLQQPYDFDALTDGTSLITYLPGAGSGAQTGVPPATWPIGQGTGMANGEVTAYTLTGTATINSSGVNDVAMLTGVGITTVMPMATNPQTATWNGAPFDPTFSYYTTANTPGVPSGTPIATGVALGALQPAVGGSSSTAYLKCQALNLSVTGTYVLLGVGQRCSLVGKTIQTAPVHFGDQPALNPEYGYQRLVAIYYIGDTNPNITLTQARLVGVAPIHDTGLGNIQDELQNAFQLTTGGS